MSNGDDLMTQTIDITKGNTVWGIIKYAAGSGTFPETDVASFDGWYADRADAKAIFDEWRKLYPQWIVALVEQHEAHFGDGDFYGIRPDLERQFREGKLP